MAKGLRVKKAFVSEKTKDVVYTYQNKIFVVEELNKYKEIFKKFKDRTGTEQNFEDDKWIVYGLNETHIYKFQYSFHKEFNLALKFFVLLEIQENEINYKTVKDMLNMIQSYANISGLFMYDNYDYVEEELNKKSGKRRYELANYLIRFLSFFHINDYELYIEDLSLVDKTKSLQRKLPNYKSILLFDFIIDEHFSKSDEEGKKMYFPLYLWWNITRVLPLRPAEFVLINNECIRHDADTNNYYLTVPRIKVNNFIQKKLKEAKYDEIRITRDIYSLISEYKLMAGHQGPYLLSYELYSSYSKADATGSKEYNKHNKELLWTSQLRRLLDRFYTEVVEEGYKYIPVKKGEGEKVNRSIEKANLGDTRHLAICSMMLQGYNPLTIAELAGHTNVDTQFNYLNHLDTYVDANILILASQVEQTLKNQEKSVNVFNNSFNTRESTIQRMILEKQSKTKFLREIDDGYCLSGNFPNDCPPNTECIMCRKFVAFTSDKANISLKTQYLNEQLDKDVKRQISMLKELFSKYKHTEHIDTELRSTSEQLSRAMSRSSVSKAYEMKIKEIVNNE